jgi:hypothetical protein
MSVHGSLKIKFENLSICDFWIYARKEYKELSDNDIPLNLFVWAGFLCIDINQNETQK